ncbi:MAG: T9SS type A sorting domain-containing protein [Bacteroidetes bacterium]|nr:T9SS type A sorting domain-containing protein [Bacteroidota bacterium]
MKKVVYFLFFSFCIYSMNAQPLTGIKTIPGNYASIQAAVDSLNAYGVGTGGVNFKIAAGQVFNLTANTFALKITATGTAANPIVFEKSGTGANPLLNITGGSGSADVGIWLNGSDYITFDGIDIIDAGTSSTNFLEYGIYLYGSASDGCGYNTFKNCTIDLNKTNTYSYGVYLNASLATSLSGTNSNNKFYNNIVSDSRYGYYFLGVSTYRDTGNEIGNLNGGISAVKYIGATTNAFNSFAIYGTYQDSLKIFNTRIDTVGGSTTGPAAVGINIGNSQNVTITGNSLNKINGLNFDVYGINFTGGAGNNIINGNTLENFSITGTAGNLNVMRLYTGTPNIDIYDNVIRNMSNAFGNVPAFYMGSCTSNTFNIFRNKAYNLNCTNTTNGVYPIHGDGTTTNFNIYNNMFYDLKAANSTTAPSVRGMEIAGGNWKIYYNTIYIDYTSNSSSNTSACIYVTSTTPTVDLRNNILVNIANVSTGTRAVSFWFVGTTYTTLNSLNNNNLFYAGTPSSKNLIFYDGTNSDMALSTFKTRMTPRESVSISEMPPFLSAISPYDVHINISSGTQVESGGQQITSPIITSDIDGDVRWGNTGYYGNGTAPDIGADEFSLIKTDAGITAFATSMDTICSGNKPISVYLKNYGPLVLTSAKINCVINGVQQPVINWAGVLAANTTINVTIGIYNFTAGNTYSIKVYSSFPNFSADTFPSNDTLFKSGIYVKSSPSIIPVTTSYSMCAGDSVQLLGTITGVSPFTVVVTNGITNLTYTGLNSVNFAKYVNPTTTSSYSFYSVTDNTGCSSANTTGMLVTVNPLPAANTGGNRAICTGTSTTLGTTAVSGNTYLWSPSSGLNNNTVSNPIAAPVATSTYTLTETNTNTSCFKLNTVVVTVNTKPVPNAGSNQTIVSGGTTTLLGSASSGSGFYLYQWKPAALLVNPNIAHPITNALTFSTVFTLVVTDSLTGCMDSANTTVLISGGTLNSMVTATPAAVCSGTPTQLLAVASGGSGNYTYNWSSVPAGFTGNTNNPSVSPLVTTKYFVTINDGTNNKLDSVLVTVYPIPTAVITPATSTTFCQGGSVVLNANTGTGLSYKWYKDNVLQTPISPSITATTGISYVVFVTNGNNCTTSSAPLIVTVNPNPPASFTIGGSSSFCLNDSVLCTANAGTGYTYQWMLNASPISGATAQTYYAKQTGLLSVVVSNTNSCSSTSSGQSITSVNPPVAIITPINSTTFCTGSSCILSATNGTGYSYVWFKNGVVISGANSANYNATTSGSYRVKVINPTACFDTSAAVILTTIAAPVATITTTGNTTFCMPDSVLLSASTGTGYTYQWKLNGVGLSGATNATLYAKLFCPGDSVYLFTSNGSAYTYQWYRNNIAITGATQSYIYIKTAGSYHVVITVGSACSATSSQVVATITTISATISYTGSPYCNNLTSVQNVILTGTSGGSFSSTAGLSINASNGDITPNTSTAGTYTITYTIAPSGACPGFTCSTSISIISFPAAAGAITSNHNDSVNVGENNAVYKVAPIANATTYVWSYTGNGATFIPSATTTVDSVKINFSSAATSGNLTVKGHNSCGDGTVSATYPVYVSSVGINENSNAINCQIYPNPTSGLITVEINGISSSLDLQLIDIIGKLIYEEKLTNFNKTITKNIDFSHYPKGIYFIKISDDKIHYIQKIINQ